MWRKATSDTALTSLWMDRFHCTDTAFFKKSKTQERADRIEARALQVVLPRAALEGNRELQFLSQSQPMPETAVIPLLDPDPFQEFTYPSILAAKRAIADYLALPLARLSEEQRAFIDTILAETLNKKVILERVQHYFKGRREDTDAHAQ